MCAARIANLNRDTNLGPEKEEGARSVIFRILLRGGKVPYQKNALWTAFNPPYRWQATGPNSPGPADHPVRFDAVV